MGMMPEQPQQPQQPNQPQQPQQPNQQQIGSALTKAIAAGLAKVKENQQARQGAQAAVSVPPAEQWKTPMTQPPMPGESGPIPPGMPPGTQRFPGGPMKLIKPDKQEIDAGVIHWSWNVSDQISVWSRYFTEDEDEGKFCGGDYVVDLVFSEGEAAVYVMTVDEAKAVGIALLSATQWEHDWQMHMGEFLAVKKEPQVVSEPVPPQEITPDQIGPGGNGGPPE